MGPPPNTYPYSGPPGQRPPVYQGMIVEQNDEAADTDRLPMHFSSTLQDLKQLGKTDTQVQVLELAIQGQLGVIIEAGAQACNKALEVRGQCHPVEVSGTHGGHTLTAGPEAPLMAK